MKLRIAWFSRFQTYLRNGVSPPHRISLPELEAAEASIIKYVQRKEFPNLTMEIKNKLVKDKHLKKLDLFLDPAGLIRIGGRLKNAAACYSVRHPILLPSKSSVTALLVKTVHRIHGHLGKSTTMSILRKSYWIIGCSSLVKRIANACVICRKYQARAASQMMSDLPEKRVVGDVAAFTNVGLDYFGPFNVVRGRATEKRYGVIFTCLASRAVHLEVAHSLTFESFINALRRFLCRRGNVTSITSDNGTNFVGGCRELREAISSWNSAAEPEMRNLVLSRLET
ncbi:hypothetical protein HAZT_HAZT011694 [Hyalella azteca]|uniref:Integrase zinc-binding domain-containing protein n=1 Tax=Hyalella azteca TaxID=294128 RepID=A0A6A0GNC5_HYAAZ|nr:hypothetical protein HAZT_HAZT011694 [Hyalella azteca]